MAAVIARPASCAPMPIGALRPQGIRGSDCFPTPALRWFVEHQLVALRRERKQDDTVDHAIGDQGSAMTVASPDRDARA